MYTLKYALLFIALILGFEPICHAQFTDQAGALGIDHLFLGSGFGSGVSLVDINGDGLDDITLANGSGIPLSIYLQTEDGFTSFNDPTIDLIARAIRSINWVDFDNDGDKDLFLTYLDEQFGSGFILLSQNVNGSFENITVQSGIISSSFPSYGSTWADYDYDGLLDLHIDVYHSGPDGSNFLYKNNGDGTFTDIALSVGVQDQQGMSFTSVFFDSDLDGDLDLFTANDRSNSANQYYQNLGGDIFQSHSEESGLGVFIDAMGVEIGDIDNDGDLDLYVTNSNDPYMNDYAGNHLFDNLGNHEFLRHGNFPIGTDNGFYWGCNLLDIDFDRDLDLFTVTSQRSPGSQSEILFINDGTGLFNSYLGDEFSASIGQHYSSAQGDMNNDGWQDLVVVDMNIGSSQVWISTPGSNHSIRIRLRGTVSNREGIGALIEVYVNGQKRIDQTTCTSSYMSQDSFTYPFGLGEETQADSVIIKWPSGIVNKLYDIPCEQTINIIENEEEVILDCSPEIQFTPVLISGLNQSFELQTSGDVVQINWSIDGELVGTGNDLTHSFESLGEHLICVELITSCTSITSCETITLFCTAPTADINYVQDNLLFTASCETDADSILWIMGDGTLLSGESIDHVYVDSGIYNVCLVISNECASDSICAEIEVTCPLPESGFEFTTELLSFQASHTGFDADSLSWIMGDGTVLSGDEISYTYAESGSYELCLIAINSCGVDSLCATIDVECPFPIAGFDLTSSSFVIEATSLSELADSLSWYLDGVLVSNGTSWSELVSELGMYEVCLETFNSCGTDSVCQSILIGPNGLVNMFSESDLLIFPNPAADIISFTLNGMEHRSLTFSIVDELGREVQEFSILPSSNSQGLITLPISALDPGSYTLLLFEKKRIIHSGQFIKD
jgi:PKD repeat protein